MPREATWDTASNRNAMGGVAVPQHSIPQNQDPGDVDFLQLARTSYEASNGWMETNLRTQWQRNLRTFNNRHGTGSKYLSLEYRHRSKVMRPKSRTATRRTEAACAQAFFSTLDLVEIEAENEGDSRNSASASIMKALINVRLNRKPVKWFPTVLGAWQDTRTLGVCITKQTWAYEERVDYELEPDVDEYGFQRYDDDNQPRYVKVPKVTVVKDQLECDLIAPENLRIDAGANWIDPINSSPFVIQLIPMYVGDVMTKMKMKDPKAGSPEWIELSEDRIRQAATNEYNSTRQARENYRQDSKERKTDVYDHDIVWVHENVARIGGQDWHWFTMGTDHLLSKPQPLNSFYLHGERPWVMGFSIVEAHKVYPASAIELTQDLQQLTTEISNQRIDNVRFAMNPRQFVRAGKNIDLSSLQRSVPGKTITMTTPSGPDADVMVDRPPDVTQSAYKEQDYINADFDELAGNFSASSVNTNRNLNETVGGMKMLKGGADVITTYDLSVFANTWAEPVLEQMIRLEQAYETDVTLLAVAGHKAKLMEKFGVSEINDELLQKKMTVRVNVGVGATDPSQQMERMGAGIKAAKEMLGDEMIRYTDTKEVMEEIWGILGYRDGGRFHMWPDGESSDIAQLQQIIDRMKEEMQKQAQGDEVKIKVAEMNTQAKLASEQIQIRGEQTDIAKIVQGYEWGIFSKREARHRLGLGPEPLGEVLLPPPVAAQQSAEQQAGQRTNGEDKGASDQRKLQFEREKLMADAGLKRELADKDRQLKILLADRSAASQERLADKGADAAERQADRDRDLAETKESQDEQLGEAIGELLKAVSALNKPKKIVRDSEGRPVGVQ